MKKILFVSYGGGHVNSLLPVYNRIRSSANVECKYLALTTAYKVLKENSLPFFGFKDIVGTEDIDALTIGRDLVGENYDNEVVPYEESIAYMGLSYSEMKQKLGDEEAQSVYNKYGRQAFYPLNTLKKILKKEQPDLVVATNSPRAERAAIDAAVELNIPSICVVDLFAYQEITWIGKPNFANKVCVMSDYVRDRFLAAGRNPNDIITTGNPAFDGLSNYSDPEAIKDYRETKGWGVSDKVVLWASSVEPAEHPYTDAKGDILLPEKVESELAKLAEENSDIRIIIRPHPNDKRTPILKSKNMEISTVDDNLDQLLNAVDCVVVLSSTVGIQAALLRKPLVNIKLSIFSRGAPYDEMGLALGVDDIKLLGTTILKGLASKPVNNSLLVIGESTGNVVRVILDALNN